METNRFWLTITFPCAEINCGFNWRAVMAAVGIQFAGCSHVIYRTARAAQDPVVSFNVPWLFSSFGIPPGTPFRLMWKTACVLEHDGAAATLHIDTSDLPPKTMVLDLRLHEKVRTAIAPATAASFVLCAIYAT